MKILFGFLFVLFSNSLLAQCPYVSGVLIDAINTGTGEGENEFMSFTTGSSPLAINAFSVGTGTTVAATGFTIDGATVTWQTLAALPAITNSAGTITNITSGSIPANTPVVILSSARSVAYDLATFGPSVYVLVFSAPGTGISGYSSVGNFANRSSPSGLRYLRVTAGACNNVVSYDKFDPALSGTDGAGAKWNAAGTITYANTGGSGAVLPIHLLSFDVYRYLQQAQVKWTTSGSSTEKYFEVERSSDGLIYSKIALIPSKKERDNQVIEYSFLDDQTTNSKHYYRLKMIDIDGSSSFSPTNIISFENKAITQTILYPNPVSNQLFFSNTKGFSSAVIVDFTGKVILEQSVQMGNNSLELSNLPKGFYLLQLKSESTIENHKIIKE